MGGGRWWPINLEHILIHLRSKESYELRGKSSFLNQIVLGFIVHSISDDFWLVYSK